MRKWWPVVAVVLTVAASSTAAAPCKTAGIAEATMPFPKNDEGDVAFARSMVPAVLPETTSALPKAVSCTRSTVKTPLGDYLLGGENGDAFPRLAMRADGKPGPIVYVAGSPLAERALALVVYTPGGLANVKRFYPAPPTDKRLAEDIAAALAGDDAAIMTFDASLRMVRYGFIPRGSMPPPVQPGVLPGGGKLNAGPRVMIAGAPDASLLDMSNGIRHRPSGFTCPQTFDGLPVLLMSIEPQQDSLSCRYRVSPGLSPQPGERMRYKITLTRAPGQTPRSVFDNLTAGARPRLKITGDRPAPLAPGPAPAPQYVAYWNTDSERGPEVQGLWVGQAGAWITEVRAQYPPTPANDAEAGKVARTLFEQVARQVR